MNSDSEVSGTLCQRSVNTRFTQFFPAFSRAIIGCQEQSIEGSKFREKKLITIVTLDFAEAASVTAVCSSATQSLGAVPKFVPDRRGVRLRSSTPRAPALSRRR